MGTWIDLKLGVKILTLGESRHIYENVDFGFGTLDSLNN